LLSYNILDAWNFKTDDIAVHNAKLKCRILKMKCFFTLVSIATIKVGDEILYDYAPRGEGESTNLFSNV